MLLIFLKFFSICAAECYAHKFKQDGVGQMRLAQMHQGAPRGMMP
jgi:hypothetical protein